MTALPIVVRELRITARRGSTYWARLGVAFVSILIGTCALMFSAQNLGPSIGSELFSILSWVGLFYCISTGLRNSADCISEEKREGTLGLLFLTDLKGYDIILGKLFAAGTHTFYSFLAAFPVFAISLMLGGVTGKQFWQTSLALLNIFFYAHAAGILASTFCMQARKAYGSAVFLTVFLFAGMPFLGNLHPQLKFLGIVNPLSAFLVAQESIRNANSTSAFWGCLLATHALSWFFLGLASWRVPHCWQERASTQGSKWSGRTRNWSCGNNEVRQAFRHRLLKINPYYWLISRDRLGPVMLWIILAIGFIVWLWLWHEYFRPGGGGWEAPVFIGTIFTVHLVFKFFVASEASRHFDKQRRDGSLAFLLTCTSLEVSEIIKGHWLALRRFFLWPVIVILTCDSLMLAWMLGVSAMNADKKAFCCMYIAGAMFMLIADGITLGWVGMWLGLSMEKPRQAAGAAISRVVFLPWLAASCCGMGGLISGGIGFALFFWFMIGIAIDVSFASHAKTKLEEKFRELAVLQPPPNYVAFERIGRMLGQAMGSLIRSIMLPFAKNR